MGAYQKGTSKSGSSSPEKILLGQMEDYVVGLSKIFYRIAYVNSRVLAFKLAEANGLLSFRKANG